MQESPYRYGEARAKRKARDLEGEQSPWKDRTYERWQRRSYLTDLSVEQSPEVGCSVSECPRTACSAGYCDDCLAFGRGRSSRESVPVGKLAVLVAVGCSIDLSIRRQHLISTVTPLRRVGCGVSPALHLFHSVESLQNRVAHWTSAWQGAPFVMPARARRSDACGKPPRGVCRI
jgi:hypothetical protein